MDIQSERRRVMLELLLECDSICRENGLKYTITGGFAESVLEGKIPDDYDYIFIAMTTGDLERFTEIVNSGAYPGREVEYLLNNENATGHEYRFCNSQTTMISVNSFGNHRNYGIYIRIMEVLKVVGDDQLQKIERMQKVWRGSQKRLASCTTSQKAQARALKLVVSAYGKKRYRRKLHELRIKIRGIDRWNDLEKETNVQIGRLKIDRRKWKYKNKTWDIRDVSAGGKTFMYTEMVGIEPPEKVIKHDIIMGREITSSLLPYKKALEGGIAEDLFAAQENRDTFNSIVKTAREPFAVTKHAWNTYLMTVDAVDLRQEYTTQRRKEIEDAYNRGDADYFHEAILDYQSKREEWLKKDVQFLGNPELDKLIDKAEEENF